MVYYDSLRGTSKTKSKSNEEKIKKVLTQTETHDIISELRLRDTTTNAKQTCDVSKASSQQSCSLSAVAQWSFA